MAWTEITFVLALLLSLIYGALGCVAFAHIKPEHKHKLSGQLLRLDPWWPYYNDMYLAGAKRSCLYGMVLFPVIIGAWIAWGILQYNNC
jgi:hypothetical protein